MPLTRIHDEGTGTVATYAYDVAGNRVMEKTVILDATGQPAVIQNNRISYDQLSRMARVTNSRFDVKFSYDSNGNRVRIETSYTNSSGQLTNIDAYNKFDSITASSSPTVRWWTAMWCMARMATRSPTTVPATG